MRVAWWSPGYPAAGDCGSLSFLSQRVSAKGRYLDSLCSYQQRPLVNASSTSDLSFVTPRLFKAPELHSYP